MKQLGQCVEGILKQDLATFRFSSPIYAFLFCSQCFPQQGEQYICSWVYGTGKENGTGKEGIGLGGNFQRLRNIRDLVDEILGFRFSWAFMFTKPNESYQLHAFKGIHSKMKIRSSCIPSLYNSNGWKYIWKNIVKKKHKKNSFTSHSAFCFEWHDVCA